MFSVILSFKLTGSGDEVVRAADALDLCVSNCTHCAVTIT